MQPPWTVSYGCVLSWKVNDNPAGVELVQVILFAGLVVYKLLLFGTMRIKSQPPSVN
jgi:hypothetical protein